MDKPHRFASCDQTNVLHCYWCSHSPNSPIHIGGFKGRVPTLMDMEIVYD